MMHGHEKSDPVIVAGKPANKAERSAAELVEPRAGSEGNAGQQSTCRTQRRLSASQALERTRPTAVTHPRWEPYAGKPHVRICGGREVTRVPTAKTLPCGLFAAPAHGSYWHIADNSRHPPFGRFRGIARHRANDRNRIENDPEADMGRERE
jgi:hypothetical protein